MLLQVYHPRGIVKEVVENITFLSGNSNGIAFPRMHHVIIINMGSPFSTAPVFGAPVQHHDTIWINGKHDQPFILTNHNTTAFYAIGLKAGMLPWLATVPAIETNDQALGAGNWAPAAIYGLRNRLQEAKDISEGFILIEEYLAQVLLHRNFANHKKIQWLGKAMHTHRVEEICRQLGVTRKKLRSDTQHYFGDSVKNIQGILRFNNTLYDIAHNTGQSLSSLHTYYDQSHFINDFKARAGITPLQYKKLCAEFPFIKHTPNFIALERETFLQFCSKND